ncbi:MAG: glycosyltransferase family 4 protein [Verrucomicrobia bacterium]|nr:glycosyltransferase family 4 protein [Verrucomicrobiota bacterium]
MRIGILHYTAWPLIGGVETVIRQQATLMAAAGHSVTIICGQGEPFSDRIPIKQVPELAVDHDSVQRSQREAASGFPGQSYFELHAKLRRILSEYLPKLDALIVHNLLTMPFNVAASQAVTEIAEEGFPVFAWTHDLAGHSQDYALPRNALFEMFRSKLPRIQYVVVSAARAREFREMTGQAPDAIVPNGLDLTSVLGLTPEVSKLFDEQWSGRPILLYPTRLLQRKNIEFCLQIVAALKSREFPVQLLITGAPNHFNPSAAAYADGLRRLAADLQIEAETVWLGQLLRVDDRQLRSLYLISDGLLFTSRQEGFGLPILEAAAYRIPIFCSNIEPLRSIVARGTVVFDLASPPRDIAGLIIQRLQTDQAYKSRQKLLENHAAKRLYFEQVEPLLRRKI